MRQLARSRFQSYIPRRTLLILITSLMASSAAFAQTATIGPTTEPLNEATLDGNSLTINLGGGETFIDATLPVDSFTLVTAPTGTSITSVTYNSTTSARIGLAFNYTDFDTDQSLSISIAAGELTLTASGTLVSNTITVTALIERASMGGTNLDEANLDDGSVTITLADERFDASLEAVNFNLVNYPPGLTIESVTRNFPTVATVDLAFDGTDFDTPYDDFYISINAADLVQTSSGVLVPDNRLTIEAQVEAPQATLTVNDPPLDEYDLDGKQVTLTLTEESFINPGALVTGNFSVVNEPPGVDIQSISGTPTATSVVLVLSHDGSDFDIVYDDFRISIDDIVLVQSSSDLVSSPVTVTYGLEPVVTGVSIPNETMRIGSMVMVTINVEDDEGNTYTLTPGGVIGGYPLFGLTRIDATTYQSSFTVTEGGLDYDASQDIHVNDILLMNGTISGELYTGQYISQDNDRIDANRPVIQYIYSSTVGPQNIGSEIILQIQAEENGLLFADTSTVNEVPVSDPRVLITETGAGRYRLNYQVAEGDNNVNPGEIVVSMYALDGAGNPSLRGTIDPNDLSIDASRPVIDRAYISSTDEDISVGETITIVVDADQTGYRNDDANTTINGVYVEPGHLTFTDLGDNSYLYSYTVQETDGAVARGDLAISIVLIDASPFSNANAPWTDLAPNNVQIITDRPSATISGPSDICLGDSALITVVLGGMAPWTMDVFDGTSTVEHTSDVSPYTFWVYPTVSTTYTITQVVDGTGNDNTGSGAADITVHPLPDVQILNLQGIYDVQSPPVVLQYTPEGGDFTGPGISESPWTFDPAAAGVTEPGSPHEIEYTYIDPNNCTSSDLREVTVVSDAGFISLEKEDACFNDTSFLITGSNIAGNTGSFSIEPTPPPGVFTDLENDTAILRPDSYESWTADRNITISYAFEDQTGSPLTIERNLTIQYLEDAQIDVIPDNRICQNEEPILLGGNYDTDYTFTSPGTGVETDSLGNYYFNPSLVSLVEGSPDTNLVIYEYTSPEQCRVRDSAELLVYDAPDAGFTVAEPCVPLDGGLVQFYSRSDTGASIGWRWNFGDPESGMNNLSSLENPTHEYDDTGAYTVSLNVTLGICVDQVEKTIVLNPKPAADFIWNSDCQSEDPVILTGNEETFNSPDSVNAWAWNIVDSAGMEIFSSDTSGRQFTYTFAPNATYTIGYRIGTKAGCLDSVKRLISLSSTYFLEQEPYLEGFELEEHGWVVQANSSQNSWTFEPVDPLEFPETAADGTRAFYTDLPASRDPEDSWVISPCFNFEDFERPMVSLDIKRSLRRDREGAVLQYTTDQQATWHNVGGVGDGGRNWYASTSIVPVVGDQPSGHSVGWTGGLGAPPDDRWYQAAHVLDELAGEPEVRFRVAFGSMGDSPTGTNDGFAFDNFRIRQRTRLTVLEYFTNANNEDCADTDSLIMQIMNEVAADVIDIQYHSQGSVADQFYQENPVPAVSRETYYGVTGIPYAILDGGIELVEQEQMAEQGHPMVYDFNTRDPSVEDIRLRSLMDPDYKLTITVTQYKPELRFSIEVEAMRDLVEKERTLYAVVLQRREDDPAYTGSNGISVFRHIARKMLPEAGGTYMGSKAWLKGQIETFDLTYSSPFFSTAEDSITIAVFMQDEETKEILQAVTNPAYVTSTADEMAPSRQILIYPNPVRELVHVYFEEMPADELRFNLYDLSGKLVTTDVLEPWQQQFTLSLNELKQGMYIVEIRSRDGRNVLHRDKLLHY